MRITVELERDKRSGTVCVRIRFLELIRETP